LREREWDFRAAPLKRALLKQNGAVVKKETTSTSGQTNSPRVFINLSLQKQLTGQLQGGLTKFRQKAKSNPQLPKYVKSERVAVVGQFNWQERPAGRPRPRSSAALPTEKSNRLTNPGCRTKKPRNISAAS
jgi:hypothetical protein